MQNYINVHRAQEAIDVIETMISKGPQKDSFSSYSTLLTYKPVGTVEFKLTDGMLSPSNFL